MAANDNVKVYIVGDASGVQPAIDQTESSLAGLEPILAELTASVKALTTQMASGFTAGAASARQLAAGVEEAKVAAAGASVGFAGMIGQIHEGAESIRTFQMRAKEFAEIYVAMFAVHEIAEFVNKMAEAAEKTQHLAETFGMTTGQVQQLQGIATATGIPIEALTKGMQMLDRNMANAAMGAKHTKQAMDAVGVSMNDGRTQMEKLATVADKFKNMDDGPKKVALAMQLFGRSGAQLIPILNLGSEGIQQLNEKMQEYGAVNDDAVAKGVVLAENVNETKLGFQGMWNVLTASLAPAFTDLVQGINGLIKAFVQSYQEGGIVAVIMGTISAAIKIVVDVVEVLGQIFSAVWGVISDIITDIAHDFADVFGASVPKNVKVTDQILNVFKDTLIIVKDAVEIFVDTVSLGFRTLTQIAVTFGKVFYDVMTRHWGAIESDWQTGMNRLAKIVDDTKNKIVADANEMAKAIAAAANGQALGGGDGGLKLPKGGGGDFDYNPTGPKKKEKKPKDDLVQKLEEELEEKITAWNKEQVAQDTAQAYSLQSIADFWAKALERTNLSAKDRYEIQKKYNAAEAAVQKEAFDQKLEGYKRELAEADKNAAAKLVILRKEAAATAAFYGAKSKEAIAANDAVYQAEKAATDQRIQLQENVLKAQQQADNARIDELEKNAQQEEQLGLITKKQLLAQEKQFEDQRYQVDLAELNKRKALIDPNRDPAAYQAINQQIEALERTHQAKLTQIDRQAELQRTQIARTAIQQTAQTFADNISKMITLQESWRQGLQNIYQGLVQMVAGVLQQIIQQWIAAFLTKLILGKQETAQQGANQVGLAGAGGTASMAAAPFPMNLTAPAFGASMATAAAAFLSIPAGEGGIYDVPGGLTMLHEKEMVLPAWAAQPLRAMIEGGQTGGTAQKSGAGDAHFHYSPTLNNHSTDWQSFVRDNQREMRRWFKREARNGTLMPQSQAA